MDKLIFTALSSIAENEFPRQQLSNEIANVSTVGFKRSLSNAMRAQKISGPGFDSRFLTSSTRTDRISLSPGSLTFTGNPLDVAMNGSTVMGVSAANGDLAFTRRGDLRVNANGVLETGDGRAVRGDNGLISVPPGYILSITGDGTVYAVSPDAQQRQPPQQVGRMLLRDASETPLTRRADGLFAPVPGNGTADGDIPAGNTPPSLTVASLEGSNASAYEAMTRLIDYSRSYEANIRFIKEAKSMDESGASMIKAS